MLRSINSSGHWTLPSLLFLFCHNPSHSCSHPEVFLRRLAATKDDDGNALQYNTLSHISRKRAVLIFDSFVESLLEDSQVGGATTPQEQTKAAEKPADLNVATLKKLKQLTKLNKPNKPKQLKKLNKLKKLKKLAKLKKQRKLKKLKKQNKFKKLNQLNMLKKAEEANETKEANEAKAK